MTSPPRTDRADQLLTVADLASHIGTHKQTARGWIHRGELRASKFGARIGWRNRRADFDAFLRRRQLTGAIARQLIFPGANEPNSAT
jgi:excisionase family DNA binding protein